MSIMEEHWLTVDQLLDLGAAEGFVPPELTKRKIERWRKENLLLRPRRISLGRHGTRSEYPPETGQQLLALCRLRRRFPHDLDAIRFSLWYKGYSLPLSDVKQSMEQLLNPILQALPLEAPDPLTAAEQLVEQLQSKRHHSSSERRLKQLHSVEDAQAVRTAVFQLILGDVPSFTAHAEEDDGERSLTELFIEVLGLNRAQTDRIGEIKPWLPQDNNQVASQLENMAIGQFLSLPSLLQTLQEANAKQLVQARTDIRHLLSFKQMATMLETLLGANAFGFGLFRELPDDPAFLCFFLLVLIRLRATPLRRGIDVIGKALRDSKLEYQRMLTFLKILRREHPTSAKEILEQTRKLNLSDAHGFEQVYNIFAAARKAMKKSSTHSSRDIQN